MAEVVDVDYLVIGAGATGMAFTDALIDHADVTVALVDRRHAVGGHWLEAYPFVRLHQSSTFYGVASTLLGGGRLQQHGPESGLHERADQAKIVSYYADVLQDRMLPSGRVSLFTGCDYLGDRTFRSRVNGAVLGVADRCRVVDATYLSPDIPAETPPPFAVADDAHVVPVGGLVRVETAPSQYVVVGSGKTATDACVWLLQRGVDPDAICWVRPRDPWMLNRALIQPDPVVFLGMVAEMLRLAGETPTLPDLFLALEAAGIMLRIDPAVTPTMARAPTLGTWELDLLRSIENVVRLGHLRSVRRGRLELEGGEVTVADDAVVVHCAADGLKIRPRQPIWQPEVITPQPVRAGFPCFGAALVGYVEATRADDAEKNRVCRSSSFGNTREDWAAMNVSGLQNASAFGAEDDIRAWAAGVALNPSRVPPGHPASADLDAALAGIGQHAGPAVARLAEWAGMPA